ncbi:MAG: hypothetical protein ACQET5_08105 [Halobacteriota archaeon]
MLPTGFLWGGALIVSMLIMLYATVTQDTSSIGGTQGPSPADD